jgi:hypothetical protein
MLAACARGAHQARSEFRLCARGGSWVCASEASPDDLHHPSLGSVQCRLSADSVRACFARLVLHRQPIHELSIPIDPPPTSSRVPTWPEPFAASSRRPVFAAATSKPCLRNPPPAAPIALAVRWPCTDWTGQQRASQTTPEALDTPSAQKRAQSQTALRGVRGSPVSVSALLAAACLLVERCRIDSLQHRRRQNHCSLLHTASKTPPAPPPPLSSPLCCCDCAPLRCGAIGESAAFLPSYPRALSAGPRPQRFPCIRLSLARLVGQRH